MRGARPLAVRLLGTLLVLAAGLPAAAGGGQAAAEAPPSWSERLDPAELLRSLLERRLGRAVAFREAGYGFSPPELRVASVEVAGPEAGSPASVEVRAARLPLSLDTLARGALSLDPLSAERARLRLAPGLALVLRDLRGRAVARSWSAPLEMAAEGELEPRGRVRLQGTASLAGEVDGRVELRDVALSLFAAALPDAERLEGRAGGVLEVSGPVRAPRRLAGRLAVRDADLAWGALRLRDEVDVRLDVAAPGETGGDWGSVELDATRARLRWGQSWDKVAGVPARVLGRVEARSDGRLRLRSWRLQVGAPAEAEDGTGAGATPPAAAPR